MVIDGHDMVELEKLVDARSLSEVLQSLVKICEGKARHLMANWQDKSAASLWARDARRLDRVITTIEN